MSRSCAFALLATAAAFAIAGCGSGGGSSSSGGGYRSTGESGSQSAGATESSDSSAPSGGEGKSGGEAAGEATNVSLASVGGLGLVLVESKGLTLYDFHKDKGGKSACYGACAEAWPPLLTGAAPTPGNGARGALLGTVERTDGTTQVTYAGHPLYTFSGDRKPGEGTGNDVKAFGGQWYALKGSGAEATGQ